MQTAPIFDRRATITTPTQTRDADGGVVLAFATLRDVWCRRADSGGREFRTSGALRDEATAIFFTRYYSDVKAKDRITCESRVYEITSPPSEIGRRQQLQIECMEVGGHS